MTRQHGAMEVKMVTIEIGSTVRMVGPCHCIPKPSGENQDFFDIRDCFHAPCPVSTVFRDGSVWARNRYGFGRRICRDALVKA